VSASIEALIRGAPSLALLKTTPKAVVGTPTKKISFNFDESLIKTPNRSSPATPKSILKTPNRGDESGRKTYSVIGTPLKATHFQAEPESKSSLEAVSKDSSSSPSGEPVPSGSSSSVSLEAVIVDQQIPTSAPIPPAEDNNASLGGIVIFSGSEINNEMNNEINNEIGNLPDFPPSSTEQSFLSLLNYPYPLGNEYLTPTFYQPQYVALGFEENYIAPPPLYPLQYFPSQLTGMATSVEAAEIQPLVPASASGHQPSVPSTESN
jgi:hypothetical protein